MILTLNGVQGLTNKQVDPIKECLLSLTLEGG